ncbi:TetR/AcrR family transcriptional regulator [Azospirillum sp. ST 5-10]|uniref:TetR/AcrR family transcriptional regulator n=1 Tax=unclassified Azospirillum TaxID=2630922 RepID=UPI003F4A68A2
MSRVDDDRKTAATARPRRPARVPHHIRRQQSEEAVLRSAERLFVERGFHRTTVDDIAKAAGLTKGAVYFHFEDKRDVLLCLLKQADARVMGPILDRLDRPDRRPTDKIVEYIHDWARVALEQRNTMFLPILMSFEFLDTDDAILQQINASYARAYEVMTRVIEAGQATGEIANRTPAREQAGVLIALADGVLLEWLRRGTTLDGVRLTQAIREILLFGLGPQPGEAAAEPKTRKPGRRKASA